MAQGRSTEIITMIKWIQTSKLSIKELSLSLRATAWLRAPLCNKPIWGPRALSLSLTHTHTLSLSFSLSLPSPLSPSLPLCLSLPHTHTLVRWQVLDGLRGVSDGIARELQDQKRRVVRSLAVVTLPHLSLFHFLSLSLSISLRLLNTHTLSRFLSLSLSLSLSLAMVPGCLGSARPLESACLRALVRVTGVRNTTPTSADP